MSRLRWRTAIMSTSTRSVFVPNSAPRRAMYATFALQISFLLGMQLMSGQEPPPHRRSTTATRRPDRARSQASAFPPCPLPSTSASYRSGVAMMFPPESRSPVDDNHFARGLVRLHDALCFTDLLEAEHVGRLGLELAGRHLPRDVLQRHIGKREARRAEHKAAEEREGYATGHLQQWIEVLDRRESSQPPGEARTAPTPQHGEGIEDGAVADEIEHRIELLGFGDALGQVWPLELDASRAQLFQHSDALLAPRGGDDPRVGIHGHVDGGLTE